MTGSRGGRRFRLSNARSRRSPGAAAWCRRRRSTSRRRRLRCPRSCVGALDVLDLAQHRRHLRSNRSGRGPRCGGAACAGSRPWPRRSSRANSTRRDRVARRFELGGAVVGVPQRDPCRDPVEPVPSREVDDRDRRLAEEVHRRRGNGDVPAEDELAHVLQPYLGDLRPFLGDDQDFSALAHTRALLLDVQRQCVVTRRVEPPNGVLARLGGSAATSRNASVSSGRQIPASEHPLHFGLSSSGSGSTGDLAARRASSMSRSVSAVQRHPLLRSWETASFTHPVLQFCCDFTSFPAGEGLPACCRSSPSSSRSR